MTTRANLVVLLAAAAALSGCGVHYCDRQSLCENDPIPTPADRRACRSSLDANQNSPCQREALSYSECAASNVMCGSDGKTDGALTATKVTNNCKAERDAQTTCCNANRSASACGSTSGGPGPTSTPSVEDELCSPTPVCPSEPAPTSAAISTCRQDIGSKRGAACFDAAVALSRCVRANVVCGADGKFDSPATTTRYGQNCQTAARTASDCCQQSRGSPACT